jgi:hypothetical protein
MSRALPLSLAAALLAVSGCGKPAAEGLFPLESGHRWTYEVRSEWENNTQERETRVITTLGTESLEDGSAWRRRSDSGVDYWLRSDETGIYRVATKTDLEEAPKPDKPPRFVLKAPLVVGTSWPSSTTTYLLRRRQEFPPEIRHSHPSIPMNFVIEAVGETVQVQAGQFKDCVRVKGTASLRLFADPVVGWRDMPLTTLEWYCPGVGLVKVRREEPANSTFLMGGTMTMELTEWQ